MRTLKASFLKFIQKANIYRFIHKVYMFSTDKVLTVGSFIGVLFALITIVATFVLTGDIKITAFITIIIYVIVGFITYVLGVIIQKVIKTTGTKHKFIFLGKHFIRSNNGDPCEINLKDVNASRFRFATEEDSHLVADLNTKAFSRSGWRDLWENKFQRNSGHIKKNKLSIMLVKSLTEHKYLGYTHVLLVTKGTWNKYLNGKISDYEFDADKVVSDQPPTKKYLEPYGLIVFSVANVTHDNELKNAPNFLEALGDIFEQALVYHVNEYLKTSLKGKEQIKILFQNMGNEFFEFFKNCNTSNTYRSKDGDRIITFEVGNDNYTV